MRFDRPILTLNHARTFVDSLLREGFTLVRVHNHTQLEVPSDAPVPDIKRAAARIREAESQNWPAIGFPDLIAYARRGLD
jgi:hypothetical protein